VVEVEEGVAPISLSTSLLVLKDGWGNDIPAVALLGVGVHFKV
jgi:hypothetical protein